MKTIALLPICLVLFACATSDDLTGGRTLDCSAGQALEVRAGIDQAAFEQGGDISGTIKFLVEVANNSHQDVTVKTLTIRPRNLQRSAFENVTRTVNQEIAEGTEHLFELPTPTFSRLPARDQRFDPEAYEFSVLLSLTNGDSYLCHFEATWAR
jgi:hypothetical protein